ncbi:MAG: peptidase M22, partial [Opitutaceae bacterium]|nr:peptidase M22 [Opitutaceae bacterium]
MASLAQLLASHGSILVLDAASASVQAGVLTRSGTAAWSASRAEAGSGVFAGTRSTLAQAGLELAQVGAFVFCEGPGSMLGIRTVAMALRTWNVLQARPVYAYQSLAVAGRHAWTLKPGAAFTVIADARRDSWHSLAVAGSGLLGPLRRVTAGELPEGDWLTPAGFRAWATPPRPVGVCSYDLAAIFPALGDGEFFRPVEAPDAFQHEAPAYRKWTA